LTPHSFVNILSALFTQPSLELTAMANPEHIEILKQGVEVWNRWRIDNYTIKPDLRGVILSGLDLSKANLIGVDLYRADLTKVNLSQANLRGAVLRRADFNGAILRKAILRWADLRQANLSEAILSQAELVEALLHRADLAGTDLSKANLSRAEIGSTVFTKNDLSAVEGLHTVRHAGPSSIGVDTLYQSQGKIPEIFLRGCGIPESFIVQLPALIVARRPIEFYSCFISYSSKDQEFTERLHADLQAKGVRVWFAPEDLKIGDRFRDRIDESIRLHDKLLLILSENSVSSPWVSDEVEAAIEREHREGRTVLFPIKIDDAVTESDKAWAAAIRRTRHIGDFTRWKDYDAYQKAFYRLLRDLKAEG
jgi:hypothetical protein